MKTILRSDYMTGAATHREYYGQFVTSAVKAVVLLKLSREKLQKALGSDPHLNNIPLAVWDNLSAPQVFETLRARFKEAGDILSMSGHVCVFKEAARQICEEIL